MAQERFGVTEGYRRLHLSQPAKAYETNKMRLSPTHKQIARLIAQGMPNREIKKVVPMSDSRLSVLKRNPLMIREIEKESKLLDSRYEGALDELGKGAKKVAEKLVKMVTDEPNVKDKVRAELGLNILNFVATAEGYGTDGKRNGGNGNYESFEQVLKVTRSVGGKGEIDEETLQQAYIELEEDNEKTEQEEAQIIELEQLRADNASDVQLFAPTSEAASATAPELHAAEDVDDGKSPASESSAFPSHELDPELEALLG